MLCVRIVNPRKDFDRVLKAYDPANGSSELYEVPDMHANKDRYKPEEEEDKQENKSQHSKLSVTSAKAVGELADQEKKYENHGMWVKIHSIMNYAPPSNTTVTCTLFQGSNVVKTIENLDCTFTTDHLDYSAVKD